MNGDIDYKKVLEDLRKKRMAIDQAISSMEAFIGEGPSVGSNFVGSSEIHRDSFIGQTIVEAASMYLRMAGRPAKTTEQISEALNRGGLQASKESVSALLMRDANAGGDIFKVGRGVWGLSEWYPGTAKRGKKKVSEKDEDPDRDAKDGENNSAASKEEPSDAS